MKKLCLFLAICCSGMLFAAEAQDKCNATVNADRLNVRMKPTIKSPKAGVLINGTRVLVTGKSGAWFELAAPESLKLYVSEVYLINGKLTNAVHLRAGNSANAPSFGKIPAGTALKAVGEADRYGWVRVVAPGNIKVYAFKDYITLDENVNLTPAVEEVKAPAEKKTEAPAAKPVVKEEKKAEKPAAKPAVKEEKKAAKPAAKPAVKEEKKAAKPAAKPVAKPAPAKENTAEQAKKIAADLKAMDAVADKDNFSVTGVLQKIPASTSIATNYAIVADGVNQAFVCGGKSSFFTSNDGKKVTVKGKLYRIKGWKAGILVME
ncbi:MAG: SH3 domain-containing protein [Lentisphaeria bacterium]|nr:SH3 domain-containing protein [Lentisphaeria bacterium]